jgi:thioredoxin 1
MAENVTDVTDDSFESEVLQADVPVAVDLWAPWCGPCKMVTPIIEELGEDNEGQLKVCKLNVDENPETASQLGVNAIPTVVLFSGGEEQNRLIGARSKADYQTAVDALLED